MTAFLGMLLALVLPVIPAVAATPSALDRHFESFYDSPELEPRFCGRNIDAFIASLKRENALPPDLRRVVIRAPKSAWHPASMLIAMNSRSASRRRDEPRLEMWYFHVIAVSGGQVYDFSFDEFPRILPIAEYFEAMFVYDRPYPIFGPSFRIRGKGPNYTPEDARAEYADFTFEIERPTVDGRTEVEATLESFEAFLDWNLR